MGLGVARHHEGYGEPGWLLRMRVCAAQGLLLVMRNYTYVFFTIQCVAAGRAEPWAAEALCVACVTLGLP